MHRIRTHSKRENIFHRIWKFINTSLFRLNLILTFMGILPVIVFIYYNMIHFDAVRVVTGCLVLITLIKANKSIQG